MLAVDKSTVGSFQVDDKRLHHPLAAATKLLGIAFSDLPELNHCVLLRARWVIDGYIGNHTVATE